MKVSLTEQLADGAFVTSTPGNSVGFFFQFITLIEIQLTSTRRKRNVIWYLVLFNLGCFSYE